MPFPLPPLDALALAWFFIGWIGYTLVFDWLPQRRATSINGAMAVVRSAWMRRMLQRDVRVMDSMLLGHLIGSVSFFASTTVLLLAGFIGVLAAAEDAHQVVADLGFTVHTAKALFELKLVLLLGIFVYAFFKFTWALRQFNYTIALVGAAPPAPAPAADLGEDAAALMGLAVLSFNAGLRAYYFAFATLGWLVHPLLFAAATAGVMVVLGRREAASEAFRRISRYARQVDDKDAGPG